MSIFKEGDKVIRTGSSGYFITRGQEYVVDYVEGHKLHLKGVRNSFDLPVVYLAEEFELVKEEKPTLTPHKHQKEIIAWANGATIQYWSESFEKWTDAACNRPSWISSNKYRVKPDNTALEKRIGKLELTLDNLDKDANEIIKEIDKLRKQL